MRIVMTTKTNAMLYATLTMAIFSVSLMTVPMLDANAAGTKQYATYWGKNHNDYGAKADFEAQALDEGSPACSGSNKVLVVTPLWMNFLDDEWIEVGIGEGRLGGFFIILAEKILFLCSSKIIRRKRLIRLN